MTSTSSNRLDHLSPEERDNALRVGRAWRELRRGASMGKLIEYFFGVGDDALEFGQMDTLDLLVQQPGWRMGDLAEALRVDPSTATRAIQRLEKFGLATRCSSTDDKRVVFVSATESGRKRHADAAARRQELLIHIMSTFDHDEFGELSAYLDRFVGSLDQFVAQLNQPSDSPE
jgi:DNA-binding MarR family transcriptional regulator